LRKSLGGADGDCRRRGAWRLRGASCVNPAGTADHRPRLRPPTSPPRLAEERVTGDAMMVHLKKFAGDRGTPTAANRAPRHVRRLRTPASTMWPTRLRDKGFSTCRPPRFEVHLAVRRRGRHWTVGGNKIAAKPLEFTKGTPPRRGYRGPTGACPRRGHPRLHGIRLRRLAGRRRRRTG